MLYIFSILNAFLFQIIVKNRGSSAEWSDVSLEGGSDDSPQLSGPQNPAATRGDAIPAWT